MVCEGGGAHPRTTLTGTTVGVEVTGSEKIWRTFQSIGDIAFAYNYSTVLIEIQACYYTCIFSFFLSVTSFQYTPSVRVHSIRLLFARTFRLL